MRELKLAGERAWNMEKLLNVREGLSRIDDEFPAIWVQNIETPLKLRTGDRYFMDWFNRRLCRDDLQQIANDYYAERGWDLDTGVPTREKLAELELEELVEIVEPILAQRKSKE